MNRKWIYFIMIISLFFLTGCENNEFDINSVEIVATDQVNIPAGTYSIPYTINDISDLIKNQGVILSFEIKNSSNEIIDGNSNVFTVEIGEVYTVRIILTTPEGEFVDKTITITALTPNQIFYTVTFDLQGGVGTFDDQSVMHGGVPNLPSTEPTKENHTFTGWFYDSELTMFCDFGDEITSNITLFAGFSPNEPTNITVVFETNGGSVIDSIQTEIGSMINAPIEPIKQGYGFVGWFSDQELNNPFLFSSTNLYSNTTLYAKWIDLSIVTYEVNYDLNGAIQLEPIVEIVNENGNALGVNPLPIRTNYLLEGYSLTSDGETLFDMNTPITYDITLYAIWIYDFEYQQNDAFFVNYFCFDNSTLNEDFYVEQRMKQQITLNLSNYRSQLNNQETAHEYGILYGENETLSYYQRGISKISNEGNILSSMTYLDFDLTTNALLENQTYYSVFFVRFDTIVLYSNVHSFETINQVEEGTSVGLEYVVSGGYYKIDNGSSIYRPSFWYEVKDGFSAKDSNFDYDSYDYIYRNGIHTVITTNTETSEKYLHVYKILFEKPYVSTLYESYTSTGSSVSLTFRTVFSFENDISYSISDAGFLYSKSTYALLRGVPGVHEADADYNTSTTIIEGDSLVFTEHDPYFVRSFAIVNGKVHYGKFIYVFSYDVTEERYLLSNSYTINETKGNIDYGIEIYVGQGVNKPYTSYINGVVVKSEFTNYIHLNVAGVYFVLHEAVSHIDQYIVNGDEVPLIGVENNGIYNDSVVIEFDTYNPNIYYTLDGEVYSYLGAVTRISQPGVYTLYYVTTSGTQSMTFTILD